MSDLLKKHPSRLLRTVWGTDGTTRDGGTGPARETPQESGPNNAAYEVFRCTCVG